jgi:hypothetical protein
MDLLKKFKEDRELEQKELSWALYVEGMAERLGTSMERANEILKEGSEVTMDEFQNILDSQLPGAPLRYEQYGVKNFSRHSSGLLETLELKSGKVLVRKFGLEDEEALIESEGKIAGRSKYIPNSVKPVKLFKNKDNTVQYGVFTEKQRFVVTRWVSEENIVRDVENFGFEGPANGLEGKAALAKALKSAETRFLLDK